LAGTPSWDIGGNPQQTPTDCYNDNPPGPFLVQPEEPCQPDPPNPSCQPPPIDVAASGTSAWTGFYGWDVPFSLDFRAQPAILNQTGEVFSTLIGARILGQKVDDEFGTALGADGTWLYISAPERTANDAPYGQDVPALGGPRSDSGIVYQLRTNAPLAPGGITRTQLWIEPGTREIPDPDPNEPPQIVNLSWPWIDVEIPDRADWTMPTPHNYIIESIGSLRGATRYTNVNESRPPWVTLQSERICPPGFDPLAVDPPFEPEDMDTVPDGTQSSPASRVFAYEPYPVGTAGFHVDRTPQIVGPHEGAKISFVRALGDLNDDGVRDFAVGSEHVKSDVIGGTGPEVGAIFIVFGRPTGVEGDYLLEQLALPINDPNRLRGVLLRGTSTGEKLARVFDDAGDVNGDGIDDVVVGNEGANGDAGEAIVIFGSPTLVSPANGWTVDEAVASGRAIRFSGENAGDLVGANVAGAGDVDADGYSDILIAAPGAAGGKGIVYLIYGSPTLNGDLHLADAGTVSLQAARFVGRSIGDAVGGGAKVVIGTDPTGGSTTAFSRGVARLGDIDGDGRGDYAIGAMLADSAGNTDSGEVYILYGRGD
jgi:hypothetical protein